MSLFGYKSIEPFLLSKHTPVGYRIYKYFGRKFIAPFLDDFGKNISQTVSVVGIDEYIGSGYSHTSLLTHWVKNPKINVVHSGLLAQNRVSYAGKSLKYRLSHPRDYRVNANFDTEVILVDDIVTTGSTLQEAYDILSKEGISVLFALTLADARF